MPCCCGGNGCLCGDPPVTRNYPSSVTVTLALGAVVPNARMPGIFKTTIPVLTGCCESTSDIQAAVNGTYVFYPGSLPQGGILNYVLPGYGAVGWYCNTGLIYIDFDVCLAYLGTAVPKTCPFGGNTYCVGRWATGTLAINGGCEQTSHAVSIPNRLVQYAFGANNTNCPTSPSFYFTRVFDLNVTVTGNF